MREAAARHVVPNPHNSPHATEIRIKMLETLEVRHKADKLERTEAFAMRGTWQEAGGAWLLSSSTFMIPWLSSLRARAGNSMQPPQMKSVRCLPAAFTV